MQKDSPDYKLITSIWVLSCTDIPAQMTYKAIKERCENGDEERSKKLVAKFPELFQIQIPEGHLDAWKKEMKAGNNRSKWLARSTNIDATIDNLSLTDVFRNRFRNSNNADPTTPELIKWGLNYLQEHFSIKAESFDRLFNRIATLLLPTLSLILAGITVICNNNSVNNSIKLERLKHETNVLSPNYHTFLNSLNSSLYTGCILKDKNKTLNEISNATSALYALSPILDSNEFTRIKNDLNIFRTNLLSNIGKDSLSVNKIKEFEEEISRLSIYMSDKLYKNYQFEFK